MPRFRHHRSQPGYLVFHHSRYRTAKVRCAEWIGGGPPNLLLLHHLQRQLPMYTHIQVAVRGRHATDVSGVKAGPAEKVE